jgi:hypothetical protein
MEFNFRLPVTSLPTFYHFLGVNFCNLLAGFLVRGRSGSVALCSWGGLAGGFDSHADAEAQPLIDRAAAAYEDACLHR